MRACSIDALCPLQEDDVLVLKLIVAHSLFGNLIEATTKVCLVWAQTVAICCTTRSRAQPPKPELAQLLLGASAVPEGLDFVSTTAVASARMAEVSILVCIMVCCLIMFRSPD